LVATLLYNLKVADLNTTDGEVRNFKFELDRDSSVLLALFSLH